MTALTTQRVQWLMRRLSRIYPAEIPYRIVGVVRAQLQERGWFDASHLPDRAPDATFGRTWVRQRHSPFVDALLVVATADQIIAQGAKVFDITVPFCDGSPDWNRDPKTGIEIPKQFGLSIDFRHIAGGVDIKYLWELNRHVWWVPIAQAYVVSGDDKYLQALSNLLDSWLAACQYPIGANWSSPVEHGIRLINWSIVWHLIGGSTSPIFDGDKGKQLLDRWLTSIYQHLRFASDNYSFYSSADNHLIGEAAGVFVGAHTWDYWSETRSLRTRAKGILEEEMLKQFSPDGVNLEQAMCYHKFSLEFLLASQLCGAANSDDFSPAYKTRVCSAIEFTAAVMDCAGRVPTIGDSDDGKVFSFVGDGATSPYQSLLAIGAVLFGSRQLKSKLYELGVEEINERLWLVVPETPEADGKSLSTELPVRFDKGGYVLLGRYLHLAGELRITMDVGPLGYNRIAGHGHADALSVLLSHQGEDFLIDPGTYCYNAAPEFRKYFRGTSAHNTVVIDGTDQSIYGGSFLWLRDVVSEVHHFSDDGVKTIVKASHNGYLRLGDPVRHFRQLTFDRDSLELVVEDRFECAKPHRCKLHWHFSPECLLEVDGDGWVATREVGTLSLQMEFADCRESIVVGGDSPPMGWVSKRFYEKQPTQVLVVEGEIRPSSTITTKFKFSPSAPLIQVVGKTMALQCS